PVENVFPEHPLRNFWLEVGARAPHDFDIVNKTLGEALTGNRELDRRPESVLKELRSVEHALLLVTDVEALHPYLRIGSIEQRLQGRFFVPTIILYPGRRSGQFSLSFLGIYPEDPNYRSIHIGG